jgi:hypothetical protein
MQEFVLVEPFNPCCDREPSESIPGKNFPGFTLKDSQVRRQGLGRIRIRGYRCHELDPDHPEWVTIVTALNFTLATVRAGNSGAALIP